MKKGLVSILIILTILATYICGLIVVNADEITKPTNLKDLLSETNTYDCDGTDLFGATTNSEGTLTETQQLSQAVLGFSLKTKNENTVYDGLPQITVLTHGMASDAASWSNNGTSSFTYDKESLVFQLQNKYDSAKIRLLKFENVINSTYGPDIYNQNLYSVPTTASELAEIEAKAKAEAENPEKVNLGEFRDGYVYQANEYTDTEIEDNTPLILVFDFSEIQDYKDGDFLYKNFTYALSDVVWEFKQKNGGFLPKINFVGHSYGGIINLKYAMAHPDMTASVFSFNTPYFGSNTTAIYQSFGLGGAAYDTLRDEIIDKTVFEKYNAIWNDNYESLYSHINYYALGGYSSLSYLALSVVVNLMGSDGISDVAKIAVMAAAMATVSIITAATIPVEILTKLLDKLGVKNEYSDFGLIAAANLLKSFKWERWLFIFYRIYFYDDGCVHVPSQLGLNYGYYEKGQENKNESGKYYKGFTRHLKQYTVLNSDFDKKADPNELAVVHNLATRDEDNIEYVCKKITMKNEAVSMTTFETQTNTDGTLTITGYSSTGISISVPNEIDGKTVTAIGERAFADIDGNSAITTIILPNTIKTIGEYAFAYNALLETVGIPASVESIGRGAFLGCTALTNVSLPSTLTYLDSTAFAECPSLTLNDVSGTNYSVANNCIIRSNELILAINPSELPSGITSIAEGAFASCTAEMNLTIPNTVTTIADNAFYGCYNLKSIVLPTSVTTIGSLAFADCGLTSVTIPSSVTQIGNGAFSGCVNLTTINYNATNCADVAENAGVFVAAGTAEEDMAVSVNIENDVTRVPAYMFSGIANLSTVTIGAGVTSVGDYAFSGGDKLSVINFNAVNLTTYSSNMFSGCGDNSATGIQVNIGNGVTSVPEYLFHYNTKITGIYLSSTVTYIGDSFDRCNELSYITVQTGNAVFTAAGNCLIRLSDNTLVLGSKNSVIPNTVTAIGDGAFDSLNIESLVIPSGVEYIGDFAFSGCYYLERLVLPETIEYIGAGAFCSWEGDQTLHILADIESLVGFHSYWITDFYAVLIWNGYGEYYTQGLEFHQIEGEEAYEVGFNYWLKNEVEVVVIPAVYDGLPVTKIQDYGFYECWELKKVILPTNGNLTCIGEYAFAMCTALENINIPDGVTEIGAWAFRAAEDLMSVTVPISAETADTFAFDFIETCTIYFEAESMPDGWDYNPSHDNFDMIFGCELSEDKSYVVSIVHSNDNQYVDGTIMPPYREGFAFAGWATTEGSSTVVYTMDDIADGTVPNGTTLYAVWVLMV